MEGGRVDEPDNMSPSDRRRADINVLQFQVGQLQSGLDRGLGALERTIEKGFEQIGTRLDRLEGRIAKIEERQAFDAARLKALEQFREEQDRREDERRIQADKDLKVAVDGSEQAKTLRLLGALLLALLTVLGTIFAILSATGAFQ